MCDVTESMFRAFKCVAAIWHFLHMFALFTFFSTCVQSCLLEMRQVRFLYQIINEIPFHKGITWGVMGNFEFSLHLIRVSVCSGEFFMFNNYHMLIRAIVILF